jgi:peptidoglycan/LPS O-acetylase OafA/YrhL
MQTNFNADNNQRVKTLDSFRFIAVFLVIFIHFGYSYPEFYPFKNQLKSNFIFSYGYLGVHLFFMISGFVIFMTLEKCASFADFILKRIVRLFPTLLFCCLLTYFFFLIFDSDKHFLRFHNSSVDFLPSLTFTDLWVWNRVFHKQVEYIDGVYWTLSYEMKFYLLIAIVYFTNKKHFFRNWMILVSVILIIYEIILKYFHSAEILQKLVLLVFFPNYIVLFTAGMFFFLVFSRRTPGLIYIIALVLLLLSELYILNNLTASIYIGVFILMFVIFIYRGQWLKFLSNPVIVKIGIISYPLYLIHAHIGVYLMSVIFKITGIQNPYFLICVCTMALIGAAFLIHTYVERPSGIFLRTLLFHNRSKNDIKPDPI